MNLKKRIIDDIIKVEGSEYTNHPSDKGGPTKYGITEKVQRQNGYKGSMKELPREVQFEIYSKQYWDINKLDDICILSEVIQEELQDTGVNMGVTVQAKFLQRSLSLLNNKGSLYPDLVQDGIIGQKTIQALKKYLEFRGQRGEVVLLRMLNSLQGVRYIEITEAREKNEDFIFGWFYNRVKI